MSTMVIGYADLRRRLEAEGKKVIIMPQLQEVSVLAATARGSANDVAGQLAALRYWISE